ncbi:Serine phosphatase RsbU, regulator of sigma subunit [Ekhidna lutea]|uniref:Serine phosphatase RsbU, regulator of sigma subunit n=1 Tax=Ekhidna lutea TaxID=447679 RepID=A0A239IDR1_EKHLU|nr:SpoIIE family protein phosphatase [Ekhidna lutea]SNS91687.1 Serine phosphatase RsbU, regulator of sigma subunit [Ekhidna lutea]
MKQVELLAQRALQVQWEEELKKATVKYHIAGSWVAVIFNLIFGATDYINVNHHFEVFFIFRLAVSALTAILLVLRKPLNISADFLIFVPFLLISVQNAFMWSLMDAEHLQKHTLAYIALFIGAGMLVLWKIYWSIIVVVISIAANIYFLAKNSTLGLEEILASGGLLTGTVMIFSIILIQTRFNLTKKEIISRLALEDSNKQLNAQKKIIESKNKDITASIRYAKKIQEAILPSENFIKKYLPNSFVFYHPRDIVSGDFYWFRHINNISYLAAVDCTGHGVPGAFMSMIGNTILNKIVPGKTQPADILNSMRSEVIDTLEQGKESAQRDGMDIALCTINHETKVLEYAGAFNPLVLIRGGEMKETKADRMPIGSYFGKIDKQYTNHSIELKGGDTFYLYSDGFQDQIGSKADRKYSSKKFKDFLQSIHQKDTEAQLLLLEKEIAEWRGDEEQLDDMLIIGVKV